MDKSELVLRKFFQLDQQQKLNWLRLIRSQNVGPVIFRDLISHYGTADAALRALPELAKRGGAPSRIKVCPVEDAENEMRICDRLGGRFIALGEREYPPLLRMTDQAPPLLCVLGSTEALTSKMIAIVGSRNASVAGMKLTQRFATGLGEHGYVIVSGLARGIDTSAHRAALRTKTVAVFAGGVDHVFPQENQNLAQAILENDGAIVSEMPIGWNPRAKDFPRRNRIVTGLCNGVVVVEAARRSGSLISARLANEMGRIVMAVPGSPLDPRSEGTNQLIRNGATLVTSTEEILEGVKPIDERNDDFNYDIYEGEENVCESGENNQCEPGENIRNKIVSALNASPTDIDDIIRFTGASNGEIQLVLIELTLAGRIERHSGNRVSLI